MLFLVGVCFIAFFVRLLPRLIVPCLVSDTYFHLAMIKRIKRQGWFKTQKQMPSYPLGYHWLLSFLPTYFLPLWERINGAVFDTLHIILFALVFSLFADGSVSQEIIWGWAPLLLALSPAWLYVGIGPRAYHATPRVFGELLIGGIFSTLWIFQTTGSWWWIAAVGLGAYLLNVSKFGAQVLLSFCMILALLQGNLSILSVLLAAGLTAYIASKGTYGPVLRGQIRHLAWYARAVKQRRLPVASRNSFDLTRRIYKDKGVSEALEYLVFRNSYVAGFYQHQLLVFVLLISFLGKEYTINPPAFVWHWLIAGVFMWFLSSTRRFLFIGEAERYLFAVAIPEYFLIGEWLATSSPGWRWGLLAHSVLLWLIYVWRFRNVYRGYYAESAARKETINFLKKLPPMKLLSFDISPMWDFAYHTYHEHFMINPKYETEVEYDEVFELYPYPKWQAVSLLDIELIVVSKVALDNARAQNVPIEFPFAVLDKLFDNSLFQVYQVPKENRLNATLLEVSKE